MQAQEYTYTPTWFIDGQPKFSVKFEPTQSQREAILELHKWSQAFCGRTVFNTEVERAIKFGERIEGSQWMARVDYNGPSVWLLTFSLRHRTHSDPYDPSPRVFSTREKGLAAMNEKIAGWESEPFINEEEEDLIEYVSEDDMFSVVLQRTYLE